MPFFVKYLTQRKESPKSLIGKDSGLLFDGIIDGLYTKDQSAHVRFLEVHRGVNIPVQGDVHAGVPRITLRVLISNDSSQQRVAKLCLSA